MFSSLRNNFFTIEHVRFASIDSQFNINLLRFASIFKFFNLNMFASLRNKFSNYRTSSLRFDIEKNLIIEAFPSLRFASISMPLKGHGNEADFLICYLMLIFSDFAADHGLINYIETKVKQKVVI
jgi:hypothetical protein